MRMFVQCGSSNKVYVLAASYMIKWLESLGQKQVHMGKNILGTWKTNLKNGIYVNGN